MQENYNNELLENETIENESSFNENALSNEETLNKKAKNNYETIQSDILEELSKKAKRDKLNEELLKQIQIVKNAEKSLEKEKQKLIKLNEKREML